MKQLPYYLPFYFLLISIFLVQSCAINPVTGKKELSFLSEQGEISMGAQNDPQIVAAFGLYQNEQIQGFINQHGKAMAAISHRPNLKYEFKVLDSPVVNAFAVPGGYVYFTRGILAHFNNEAEFIGVLGHEIGHITARHSARQMTSQYLLQGGFIVGMLASEEFAQYGELAMAGIQLLSLSFSRNHENESDKLGVEYSTQIGYDAREMANFFRTIQRLQGDSGQAVPNFLSTHPDPGDRFNRVGQLAMEQQTKLPDQEYKVGRDSYLRMIDGLTYGEDPRQGYVADGRFYHPDLLFEFPVPARWRVVNNPSQVDMMPPDTQDALMILTLGKGNTLEEAAQNFIQQAQLTNAQSQRTTINGFQALFVLAEQANPQDPSPDKVAKIQSFYINDQEKGIIYAFHGMTYAPLYNQYRPIFSQCAQGFRRLTDRRRIDVKAERIRIKTVARTTTFSQAMSSFGMPKDRHEELALINGMQLNTQVQKGTLIKVIGN
ncbi:MAG: M48 family metalloprotease [Bacteroidota bacterium]